ncbi:MAG: S41 family peptidase [Planctomycetota bacterium]
MSQVADNCSKSSMGLFRRVTGVCAGALILAATSLASAAQPAGTAVAAATLADDWSDRVWTAAQGGAEAEFRNLFENVPAIDHPYLIELRDATEQYRRSLAATEADRLERRETLREELAEALKKPNDADSLSEALRAATELQLLADDPATLLADRQVARAIELGEQRARTAEDEGDWLIASELFFRLNALFDESGRFKDDARRQADRISMLRLYAPEQYWQIRNDRRVASGEDPLPPYNPWGDSADEKLSGIDAQPVALAIWRASRFHVDRPGASELLAGGFEAVARLVDMSEMRTPFPQLADDMERERFHAYLQERARGLRVNADATGRDIRSAITSLLDNNDRTVGLPDEAILHEFGDGAMMQLDDYSSFVWPDEVRQFDRAMQGAFVGVGIQISLDAEQRLQVVTPLAGTPAQRAGIRSDDVIIAVDGRPTLGFDLDQAVSIITGPANTRVTLTVEREDADGEARNIDFELRREKIDLHSVRGWERNGPGEADWNWLIDEEHRIGYIRVSQFQGDTTREMRRALQQMGPQPINGLILDLRYNPGGLLDEAVKMVSQFAARQTVVTVEDANGQTLATERSNSGRTPLANVPTVVLVNQGSASASEIVAGALQDYADDGLVDVVVLGGRTFGKGSVQNVWEIGSNNDGRTMVKLTTQYYRLPGGRLIHRDRHPLQPTRGVEPDLEVTLLPEQITKSLEIRRDADIIPLDENGQPIADQPPADPAGLLAEGVDLQLQTALVLLQSRAIDGETIAAALGNELQPIREAVR